MKFKTIVNGTIEMEEPISFILKELYEKNLLVDLDKEDLESTLEHEITADMIGKIKTLIVTKVDEWNYFDVMKILGF